MRPQTPVRVLLDLLMATMDSVSVWSAAAGDRALGLAWRDAVTDRMIGAGEYVPYEHLVRAAADELGMPPEAPNELWKAWQEMRPWPDAVAIERLRVPYAFVTNCSADLAAIVVERSSLRPAFALTAQDAGWYKPRPEIYRLACHRIGADPTETLFVAGAAYDARGASRAGLRAILVDRRHEDSALPAEIDVVSSLGDALARV